MRKLGVFVRESGRVPRRDDIDTIAGQIHVKARRAVLKRNFHVKAIVQYPDGRRSESGGGSCRCAQRFRASVAGLGFGLASASRSPRMY